jgi:GT2 family glycosyltransferase
MKILIVKYKIEPYYRDDKDILLWDNSKHNIGFARAVNELLKKTGEEDVILLGDDAYPVGDAFKILQQTAYSDKSIGIVQPKLVLPDGRIDSTGHKIVWKRPLGHILVLGRGSQEQDRGQYDLDTELPSCDFACSFIKREVIEKVGRLDPYFVQGFDDVEYGIRTRRHGYRVVYEPRAKVIHARGHVLIDDGNGRVRLRDGLDKFKMKSSPVLYHLLIKNHWWKMLVSAYFWNILGILAGVKNGNAMYTAMKIRGIVPV